MGSIATSHLSGTQFDLELGLLCVLEFQVGFQGFLQSTKNMLVWCQV